MKKTGIIDILFDSVNMVFMLIIALLTAYPFIYVLMYSFSKSTEVRGLLLLPAGFNLDSYTVIFTGSNRILNALLVSVARSTIAPAILSVICSMAAYVLTRRELVFRGVIMKFFIITMYFNSGMIPVYLLYSKLKLTGTFWVYIVPFLFDVFYMILIKTYIEGLPKSLEESALIDGANDLQLFFSIVFPLIKPVIAAILLFACINQWNIYYDTMIFNAEHKELHTLQYILMVLIDTSTQSKEMARMRQSQQQVITPESIRMALTVITVIPILFVYPFLQKHFAKGLLIGSIKG